MKEEKCDTSCKKKCWLAAVIVVLVSGLISWALISLYSSPSYKPEEELLTEPETGAAEIAAPIQEEAVTPAPEVKAESASPAPASTPAPTVPANQKKSKK